jgi:hypothetical protein
LRKFKVIEIYVSLNCALVKLYNIRLQFLEAISYVLKDFRESRSRSLFRTLILISPFARTEDDRPI